MDNTDKVFLVYCGVVLAIGGWMIYKGIKGITENCGSRKIKFDGKEYWVEK